MVFLFVWLAINKKFLTHPINLLPKTKWQQFQFKAVAVADQDLQTRGRSSRPWEKGGAVSEKSFLVLGPLFGLKRRGAGPQGPFLGSASESTLLLRYWWLQSVNKGVLLAKAILFLASRVFFLHNDGG